MNQQQIYVYANLNEDKSIDSIKIYLNDSYIEITEKSIFIQQKKTWNKNIDKTKYHFGNNTLIVLKDEIILKIYVGHFKYGKFLTMSINKTQFNNKKILRIFFDTNLKNYQSIDGLIGIMGKKKFTLSYDKLEASYGRNKGHYKVWGKHSCFFFDSSYESFLS